MPKSTTQGNKGTPKRQWFQTQIPQSLNPASQSIKRHRISGAVIKMLQAEEDWETWVNQYNATTGTDPITDPVASITLAAAKGRSKVQLCYACHDPIGQDRIKWGTPDPLRQSAEGYCPDCFKRLNCVQVP